MQITFVRFWRQASLLLTLTLIAGVRPIGADALDKSSNADNARWQLYLTRHYEEYLKLVPRSLEHRSPQWHSNAFYPEMAAAVSIDKVGRWGGAEETEIRQLLAVSPDAIRYFSAMKALLHGDLKEAGQFFEGTAPNYNSWEVLVKDLNAHDCAIAANYFAALFMIGHRGMSGFQADSVYNASPGIGTPGLWS